MDKKETPAVAAVRCIFRWWLGAAGVFLLLWQERVGAETLPSTAPYFEVLGATAGRDAFPLKSTRVQALLTGVLAEVRVSQTYSNDGSRPLEARYVFPGSTRAAVHALTMTVGGRRVEAQLREKTEARKTYDAARKAGQAASLLEAHRSNVFEMSVANIQPGETVTVELAYTERILAVDGAWEWVFPTVVGPRYSRHTGAETESSAIPQPPLRAEGSLAEEPVCTLTVDVVSALPLGAIECATHRIAAARETHRARIELDGTMGPVLNRDFILRYRTLGESLEAGLLVDDWKGERYFLLTVQPPARVTRANIPPRDYVFVVDVSGSMHGFPLQTAKTLLEDLFKGLRTGDSFNVLLFSGDSRLLSPEPLAATPETTAAALALLSRQSGGGGTELLSALERALSLPVRAGVARSLVVVTDGYIDLEAEAYALVASRLGEASLFAFGIGSSVNRELIERLARAGRSEPAVIDQGSAAGREAARFRALIESPVLTRVRADLGALGARDVLPEAAPDVLALRPLTWVGKATLGAKGRIAVEGQTGAGPWRHEIDLDHAVDLGGRGLLARLWAREKLAVLDDLHALGSDRERRRREIIDLGLQANLLTRFTSFVAVDTTPRVAAAPADTVRQPAQTPQGLTMGEDVPTTPEPETVGLLGVAALAVLWRTWRQCRKDRVPATTG